MALSSRIRCPAALVALSLAVPALGSVPNTCELLSRKDVEEVTGKKVAKVFHQGTPKAPPHRRSECHFRLDTGTEGPKPRTIVQLSERQDAAAMTLYYEQNLRKGGANGARSEKVEGLGDEAWWIGAPTRQIFVRKDRLSLAIQVIPQADRTAREQAARLARIVVGKLPP